MAVIPVGGGGEQKGEDMFEVLASVMRPFFFKGMKSNEAWKDQA